MLKGTMPYIFIEMKLYLLLNIYLLFININGDLIIISEP